VNNLGNLCQILLEETQGVGFVTMIAATSSSINLATVLGTDHTSLIGLETHHREEAIVDVEQLVPWAGIRYEDLVASLSSGLQTGPDHHHSRQFTVSPSGWLKGDMILCP